jgi:hypothetical protein
VEWGVGGRSVFRKGHWSELPSAHAGLGSSPHDPLRGQCQVGSLTGAVHLSKGNAGVLRLAQRGQKPRVEQKGKSWLDPDFQYEYGPGNRGLSILLSIKSFKQEVSEKLPQG